MRGRVSKILVTGAAGFIGSEFVRQSVKQGFEIVAVDKLTYAASLERLAQVKGRYSFYRADICNLSKIEAIFKKERPKAVVHFAAETHVDRSIKNAYPFLETNVKGTHILLEAARHWGVKRFIHISTDEVYGDTHRGSFKEDDPLLPSSPYAVSKASADLLIKAYQRTYGFPAIIVRPSNNYGPWQYPEKFIPVVILKALNDEKIPIYGKGINKREWLDLSDCARGILTVVNRGRLGQVYNLGSGKERKNIDVALTILRLLDKPKKLISFVKDRPGHDYRYSLDSSKIRRLGFKPRVSFDQGLKETVGWCRQNDQWINRRLKLLQAYWRQAYG
jgi:dTDP-glucose 4,6-dehydratase